MRPRRRQDLPAKVYFGFFGCAIAAFVWQFRLRFPFDDTFISFRYAEHLASGNGLVWNIGGPHTEGYTNFLFVLLLAGVRFFTHDLLAAAQLLGLVSTILTGLFLYSIARSWRNVFVGILATLLYFAAPLTWINALSGMETSVFILFCVSSIAFFIQRPRTAFFFALLATLTRPEAAMLAAIAFLILYFKSPSKKSVLLGFTFFYLLPLTLYLVWKYYYFGFLLPNSFYVKVLEPGHTLAPGLQYVRLFLISAIALLIASFGIRRPLGASTLAVVALWTIGLVLFYIFVRPLEGLYDRFLWPAFVMLCLMASAGLYDRTERFGKRAFLAFSLLLFAANSFVMFHAPRTEQSLSAHEEVWDANMDDIISELKLLPHFDSLTLGYGDAGYVVYKSGIRHLDLVGLNDTRIAHARSAQERSDVILSEHPDVLLLPATSADSCYHLVEDAYGLARTDLFTPTASLDAFPYRLVLYINAQSPFAADIQSYVQYRLHSTHTLLQATPCLR
jgi:arabinofuranosyltransferase